LDGRLPPAYLTGGTSSFAEFLKNSEPSLLPRKPAGSDASPHGTTIVAVVYKDGVVMAGDRRATLGNVVAQRDIEKVMPADEHSVVGIAGSAGTAMALVKLFQVELEHYEKIEGEELSVDGKANRLSVLLRGNLDMALMGLAVVPLFGAWDPIKKTGRVFSYDVTGGRYEEHDHYAVGSGSLFARGSLKKLYQPNMAAASAYRICLEALYDAADDDSATGGPDLTRKIYPVVADVTQDGYRRVDDTELSAVVEAVLSKRMLRPDGPAADIS